MKKFGSLLFAFILLLSCFSFAGCGSTKNITKYITHTTSNVSYTSAGQVFNVTCYVNQSKFDLSDASKIEVKVNGDKCTANYISDSGYFTFTYVDKDYELIDVEVDKATATLSDGAKSGKDEYGISIGGMILVGLILTLVAIGAFWICSSAYSNIGMVVVNGAAFIFTLGSWLAFGVARGIIMTVFFILYAIVTQSILANN